MTVDKLTFLEKKAYYMSKAEFIERGHGTAEKYFELRNAIAARAHKGSFEVPTKSK